jgi:hypothetical protein
MIWASLIFIVFCFWFFVVELGPGNLLNHSLRYRQWQGGKWGRCSGVAWGNRLIKLSDESLQFDEDWGPL